MKLDLNKEIYEGWTVGDFIKNLEPIFQMIMEGNSWVKPFTSKVEVRNWTAMNQPYYKKPIKEVVDYFWEEAKKYSQRPSYW